MAASLVGGAFLSASLQVLFDRLASREVINFFKGNEKLNGKLIKKLKITLISVNNLLDDAEEKQITNPHVKQWLDELKDAVYVADDLLDEIAYEAKLLDSNDAESCELPKIFASLRINESKLEKQLEEILEELKDLMEQKDALGLVEGTAGLNPFPQLERRTTSLVDESGVYGRDADKEAIIRMLLADEDICPGVVPIVGMGGVGKTTLAQLVYKDDRVKQKFQVKAWVCVSEEFDVFKVARSVLKEFAPGVLNIDGMTPNQLHNELEKRLMGQKFFLVLDDMWDDSHKSWEILLLPLKSGAQGSRIIVTTRSNTVASITRTSRTHHLQVLSNEHCWSLFARRAFKNEICSMYPKLEGIGKEIVSRCKGLPLAANTLGCLLSSERDARKWERILKSNTWDMQGEHILPALRLSYHCLPPNLKHCFAYCAIFPKSYQFEKEKLVHLWMAEGFLFVREGNLAMEEIGDEYFDGLVSRSFLQRSAANRSSFVMHDLFHDLAKSISGDFCLRLEADDLLKIPPMTRHLSYAPLLYNASEKFAGGDEAQQLRTFLPIHMSKWLEDRYIDKEVIHHLLPTLKRLRVLSLSEYVNIIDFPESITKMKHLRLLDFSGTSIKNLPSAISNLFNLQTLNLEYCKHLVELPGSIGSLKCLQYLNLGGTAIKQLPEFSLCPLKILILHSCINLVQLPSKLGTLTKLCNLDISETELQEMPPQFGNLTNLKNLSIFLWEIKHVLVSRN